jgi:hypothetical protein
MMSLFVGNGMGNVCVCLLRTMPSIVVDESMQNVVRTTNICEFDLAKQ